MELIIEENQPCLDKSSKYDKTIELCLKYDNFKLIIEENQPCLDPDGSIQKCIK